MAGNFNTILAVIDPTTDIQRALARACGLARDTGASVHAYLCCYSAESVDDYAALRRVELARHQAWLEVLLATHAHAGVTITREVEWHEDWRESIARAAARRGADLVIKSSFRRSAVRRRLLESSDWALLRHARCPVLLVKQDDVQPYACVLAACAPLSADAPHRALDVEVVALARGIAGTRAVLHAVTACDAADRHGASRALAARAGVAPDAAHAVVADPADAIVDCAALLTADLVVMGSVARGGLGALGRGNTAERALDRLDTDLLVVTLHQ